MLRSWNNQVHAQELVVKGQPARVMRLHKSGDEQQLVHDGTSTYADMV